MIDCRQLNFSYGGNREPVLKNVSLTVDRGEALILMGPSGCGKSTLAYCLAGLYPEYAGKITGEILLDGKKLGELTPNLRSRKVSIMFQNPDDQFCMDRVDREILFALENINYSGDMHKRMRNVLALTGIPELERARVGQLSGGTKQKVALAAALAIGDTGESLLILDEPFANIDQEAGWEIAAKLKELAKNTGLSLLIIDHKLDYWKDMVSRIVIMDRDGCIVEDHIQPGQLTMYRGLFEELGIFYQESYERVSSKAPSKDEAAIIAEDMSVSRGKEKIIHSVSLKVQKGGITAVMGKSGSGKTTMLWALAGLLPHKGRLTLCGRVGVVFQNPGYQFLTQQVLDEVLYTLKAGSPDEEDCRLEEKAWDWLREFGLEKYGKISPYMLSQGQQRRLAVLSMLAGEQEILLLDEPTYAQDERATRFIMKRLAERAAGGLTVIIATHDRALAAAYAHEIIWLDKGEVINDGQAEPGI